jgi:hypothetical protein
MKPENRALDEAIGAVMELRERITDIEKKLDDEECEPLYTELAADEMILEAVRLHGAVRRIRLLDR